MPNKPLIGPELPVKEGPVTTIEMRKALKHFKKGNAAVEWATALCQTCWANKTIPTEWHQAIAIPITRRVA